MSEQTTNEPHTCGDEEFTELRLEECIVTGRRSALSSRKELDPEFDNTGPQKCATESRTRGSRGAPGCQSTKRPPSATGQRPQSASSRRQRAVRRNISGSYVDESLFGPVTDPTFASLSAKTKQRPVKPFIFDCTDYKAKSTSSNNTPSSQKSATPRPRSARLHIQPSFVDESLFGDQFEPSTWRAPWDKKDSRPKPFIFDSTNYREKQQRANSLDTRIRSASSAKQLPPWR